MNRKILLLDAEPVVRQVVTDILRHDGYRIRATGSSAEALNIAREEVPDLLLTNVFVPGSTGRDAAKLVKSVCPNVRVLIVAGVPDSEQIQDAFTDGPLDFFPKPFTAMQLRQKVREVLDQPPAD
jgi:DNA-binding NtrC family response regulator